MNDSLIRLPMFHEQLVITVVNCTIFYKWSIFTGKMN